VSATILLIVVFMFNGDPAIISVRAPSADVCASVEPQALAEIEKDPKVRAAVGDCFTLTGQDKA